ncbi:MAG: fibronectin type III domain-containing protein [Ignavibacteria bacterium]|nr:fibronectin type III domain-containing protein [Ignavibacteria bacterium]
MSKVLPALDTPRVTLQVPPGYESYVWTNSADTNITISTSNLLNVASPGNYIVRVTEQFGCSSSFSNGFTVINANGPNKPSAPASLLATTLSKTSLRLDWSDDPSPAYNETGFEIYQGDKTGGPYKLINITGADVNTFTVNNLHPNVTYFYKVRSVNNTAASAASNEAYGKTDNDNQAPTAPTNLTITNVTLNSISLSWTAATDDVGVVAYDVYINDQKSFITTQTQFTVYPLTRGTTYTFKIKAKDFAGNLSPASNQVTGTPALNGLNYKYYTFTGTWSNLPDFSTLTPNITGNMANVAITPRTQNDNFAFLWEGYISIPTTGTYYFRTNSDDGSRLWLGTLNGAGSPYTFSGSPVVNNDGLHGGQDATSVALSLTAGVYPFAAAFYEQGGGEVMTVSWRTPASGTNYVVIPNSAFTEGVITNGTMPMDPSNLVAKATSYKNINLAWNDNSDNETGFEIWRSANSTTGFSTIGTAAANATIYSDSVQLTANTQYYYKIRAIGSYGESRLVDNINFTEASWKLNNNYTDGSGNGRTITASGSPSFDASNKMEGSHSLLLNGTSQYTTMPTTGSFLQTAYDQKSIAFWMRSNSNTGSELWQISVVMMMGWHCY